MKSLYHLLSVGLLLLVITSCGGGGSSGSDNSSPTNNSSSNFNNFVEETIDSSRPKFKGVALAYSSNPNSIELAWVKASDDNTSEDSIGYKVYASKGDSKHDDLVKDKNLVDTVLALDSYTLNGLESNTTYYITVVAVDKDNKTNTQNPVSEIRTISSNFTTSKTPQDLNANKDITITANATNEFLVTGDLTVEANDLVIIDNNNGQSLKKVESVSTENGTTTIVTSNAALEEFVENGIIQSVVTIENLSALASSGKKNQPFVYEHSSGMFKTEGTSLPESKKEKSSADEFTSKAEFSAEVKAGIEINFEPTINTKIEFESFSLKALEVNAKGVFTLDAFLELNLNSATELHKKVELESIALKKAYIYFVNGVPVYQEIFLDFFAEVDINTTGTFTAKERLQARQEVNLGFIYDSSRSGYELIKDSTLTKSLHFTIETTAGIEATFKIYPVISTRFYKAARSSIYLIPEITSNAEITSSFFDPEFSKFDVDFLVKSHASVSLSVFSKTLASGDTGIYNLFKQTFFSLHSLEFSKETATAKTGKSSEFELKITDGENNKVTANGITWAVKDAGGNKIPAKINLSDGNKKASITIDSEGEYTVTAQAIGNGFLGELGKRSASTTISVSPDSNNTTNPNPTEGKTEKRTITYSLNSSTYEVLTDGEWVDTGIPGNARLTLNLTIKDGKVTEVDQDTTLQDPDENQGPNYVVSNINRTFSSTPLGGNSFKIINNYSFTITQTVDGKTTQMGLEYSADLTITFSDDLKTITVNGSTNMKTTHSGESSNVRSRYPNATGTSVD